jgi:argininosuccinate lyase
MRQQIHTEYRGFRTPGIRLTEPLLPDVTGHSSEAELPVLYAYHLFDKAHLTMLAEENLIPRQDAIAMLRALRDMEVEGVEKVRLEAGGGMHSAEQYLIRRLGEAVGGRIHLGRSSGDLSVVARRIRQRDRLIELMHEINTLRAVVLDVAEANLDAVMPGYTHTQHAQPVTLGHQLMAWASILERDLQRADTAYQRVNQSPAGAAIMTGSNFPLNRHRTAELLGFDGIIKNTFDAILSLDVVLDTFHAVASVNLNLSRWAADLNFWFTSEAGYIDIPDRFCGTSSIMMQKKNPYALEFIRGAVTDSMGGLVTAFAVQKAATGDPIQDQRYMFDALFRSFDLAVRGLRWYTQLLPAMEVKKDHMRDMAASYWAQATDVAGALVREKDLPWRTAHQIVGILVRFSYERGIKPRDVTPELLDEAAFEYMGKPVGLSQAALQKALDPVAFVNGRTLYGGPAPEECRRRLPEYRAQLHRDQALVGEKEVRLKQAAEKQETAIDALLK